MAIWPSALLTWFSVTPSPAPEAPRPEVIAPISDAGRAEQVNRIARGVGVGIDQGLVGNGFGQRLHVDVAFGRRVGQFLGLRLHGTVVHSLRQEAYDPVVFGGLGLFGRSAVVGGLIRVYGGGGLLVGGRPNPTPEGSSFGVSGGGYLGLEMFGVPRFSFSIEVSGQGPVHDLDLDAGAGVLGGINVYFGRLHPG